MIKIIESEIIKRHHGEDYEVIKKSNNGKNLLIKSIDDKMNPYEIVLDYDNPNYSKSYAYDNLDLAIEKFDKWCLDGKSRNEILDKVKDLYHSFEITNSKFKDVISIYANPRWNEFSVQWKASGFFVTDRYKNNSYNNTKEFIIELEKANEYARMLNKESEFLYEFI